MKDEDGEEKWELSSCGSSVLNARTVPMCAATFFCCHFCEGEQAANQLKFIASLITS